MKRILSCCFALVLAFSLVSTSLVFSEEATEKAPAQTEEVEKDKAAPTEPEEVKPPEAEESKTPEAAEPEKAEEE